MFQVDTDADGRPTAVADPLGRITRMEYGDPDPSTGVAPSMSPPPPVQRGQGAAGGTMGEYATIIRYAAVTSAVGLLYMGHVYDVQMAAIIKKLFGDHIGANSNGSGDGDESNGPAAASASGGGGGNDNGRKKAPPEEEDDDDDDFIREPKPTKSDRNRRKEGNSGEFGKNGSENARARDAGKKAGLEEGTDAWRAYHDDINGKNYNFQQLFETAKEIFKRFFGE